METGNYDIMEPNETCPTDNNLDVILVPTVGISQTGVRLGYGHGFYDRFLSSHKIVNNLTKAIVVDSLRPSEPSINS